ncbi:MAG: DUF1634 domain-containing protein [Bacteroidetes bacterium]|nr:DUF1634 domain-containing protein [Bacteroidota bacterium]
MTARESQTKETAGPVVTDSASRMEILVGYILLIGVLLSITLIGIGIIWHYAATGKLGLVYSISGMNLYRFVLSDFYQAAHMPLRPRLMVNLGIVTLMLTPYVRVFASMVYFAFAERNGRYTVFTGFVFLVLTYSLFLR